MSIQLARCFFISIILLSAICGSSTAQEALPDESSDITIIKIALSPTGEAIWTVELKFPLNTPLEVQSFNRLSADFESNGQSFISLTPFTNAVKPRGTCNSKKCLILHLCLMITVRFHYPLYGPISPILMQIQ